MRRPAMKRPKAVKPPLPEPVAGDPLDERLQEIIATGYPAEAPSASLQRRIADLIASQRSLQAPDGARAQEAKSAARGERIASIVAAGIRTMWQLFTQHAK